jgi:hypothetical protein
VKVTPDEPGYVRDRLVSSDDNRVHVLFYKKGAGGNPDEPWKLPTIASGSGTDRYMTVMVIVGNELKGNARKLIRDGVR